MSRDRGSSAIFRKRASGISRRPKKAWMRPRWLWAICTATASASRKISLRRRKWYIKAAEKGNEKAKAELLQIKLEADPEKRFRNRKVASFKGDAKAMAEVATMYLTGTGVEKNEENALEWFKKAFEYGNVSVRGELQRLAAGDRCQAPGGECGP